MYPVNSERLNMRVVLIDPELSTQDMIVLCPIDSISCVDVVVTTDDQADRRIDRHADNE